MGKSVHNEETKKLMEGILKLQSVDECYAFFEDLCTVNELLSLGQRFEVANMLRNHKTYNEVAEATGASTATISRVNRCLKTQSRKINYFNEILLPMLYNRSSEAADMDYF